MGCVAVMLLCLFTQARAWIPGSGSGISSAGRTREVSTISSLISDGCGWNFCETIALVFVLCFSCNGKSWNEDLKWNVLPPEAPQMWPIIRQLEVLPGTSWSVSTLKWARSSLLSLPTQRSPKVSLFWAEKTYKLHKQASTLAFKLTGRREYTFSRKNRLLGH